MNSINQTEKYSGMSEKYGFINTSSVLSTLESKGWVIHSIQEANARKPEKNGYQRHVIRLRHPDFTSIPGLSEENATIPELVVMNSHCGDSSFRMFFGAVRIACANGIIAGTGFKTLKIIHSKNFTDKLIQGTDYMTNNIPELFEVLQKLQNVELSQGQVNELIQSCFKERLKNVKNIVKVDFQADALRSQDEKSDAYTVFNRVQEKIMRGGITYLQNVYRKDENGNVTAIDTVQRRTRQTNSVNQTLKLNQFVFDQTLKLVA